MMRIESRKIASVLRTAAVMLCVFGVAAAAAHAQDEAPAAPPAGAQQGPPPGGGRGAMMDPDKMTARLTRALDLTADQQTQVKAILVAQQEKMKATPEMSRADRRAAREEMESKINAVLTADQKTKYADIQSRMRGRRGGAGEGNTPPPPPPPPGV